MSNLDFTSLYPHSWQIIGSPPPGTIAALALTAGAATTLFVGTRTGLYRNRHPNWDDGWQRLPNAPIEILALALSPNFTEDRTIFAGTGSGLFVSHDGGDSWLAPSTPLPDPVILCLALSPNYAADGILVAGTLEEGVYFSDSRGKRWSARTVGMLDAAVYSLAFSPNFAQDETLFAGTEGALYYSYNGARAWKLLDFPEEAAPILTLALSPDFAQDETIYAGTEQQGLYRSTDSGKSWQKLALSARSINSVLVSPQDGSLLAATNQGLYCSDDGGERWHFLLNQPDAFTLAANETLIITGLINQGIWLTQNGAYWHSIFSLPARPLTGMTLSPDFASDGLGFLFGPQEGIWRTEDGGRSWHSINEKLPNADIFSLAISPYFKQDRLLLAASSAGLLISEDAGNRWSTWLTTPLTQVHFSPTGVFVVVATANGELQIVSGREGHWHSFDNPGGRQTQVLAVAIADDGQRYVATLDRAQETATIWQGRDGDFVQLLSQSADVSSLVHFLLPQSTSGARNWYASLDQQLWEFASGATVDKVTPKLLFSAADDSKILSLTGEADGSKLFASTGRLIYQVTKANPSKVVHDFGDERAVALTLLPAHEGEITAFALLLGGQVCSGKL